MACTNCSTKSSTSVPKGCGSHGSCGTDSCNKLNVFDWLSNMHYPSGFEAFDIVEVRFKNGRKDFYKNTERLPLLIGDVVATESSSGHDVGTITLTGELVRVQMNKKKVDPKSELLRIYRKATQKDIDIWQEVRAKEEPFKVRARELAIQLSLEMKISDIEFQGDGSKATFYYTANDRVDFRQLIKEYAKEFSVRIEMKQVGFRQEASRLGGIGSCGRELCCSTWLTDFRSVNTSAARYQQLSLNPQKLAGQCGKLKCCLNYELDTYLDALKDLPDLDTKLSTENGIAYCQKLDIFKRVMWFAYPENSANWYKVSVDQVKEILSLNATGERIENIEDYVVEIESENKTVKFDEDSLARFDQPKRKKKPQKKRKPGEKVESSDRPERQPRSDRGPRPERTNTPRFVDAANKTERSKHVNTAREDQKSRPPRPQRSQNTPNVKVVEKKENESLENKLPKTGEETSDTNRKKNIHKRNKNFKSKGSNQPNKNDDQKQ